MMEWKNDVPPPSRFPQDPELWQKNQSQEAYQGLKAYHYPLVVGPPAALARRAGRMRLRRDDLDFRDHCYTYAWEGLDNDVAIGTWTHSHPELGRVCGSFDWVYGRAASPGDAPRPPGRPGEPLLRLRTGGGMRRAKAPGLVLRKSCAGELVDYDLRLPEDLLACLTGHFIMNLDFRARDERRAQPVIVQPPGGGIDTFPEGLAPADPSDVIALPTRARLRELALAAERTLELAAQDAPFDGRGSVPARIFALSRAYSQYLAAACRCAAMPLGRGFPPFSHWLIRATGRALPSATGPDALETWTGRLGIGTPSPEEWPGDGVVVDLAQSLAASFWHAPGTRTEHRERLLIWVGRRFSADPLHRKDTERMADAGERRLARIEQEVEAARMAELGRVLSVDDWRGLAAGASSIPPAAELDPELWLHAITLDGVPGRRLYDGWHAAVYAALAAAGAGRAAMDQAKARAEGSRLLDDFYALLGYVPPERRGGARRGKLCRRVRGKMGKFLCGEVNPQEAREFREHLDACPGCHVAFNAYVADRLAWGCEPQPQAAFLREQLHAGVARLRLRLGSLPEDLEAAADTLVAASRAATGSLRAVPVGDGEHPFAGFCPAGGAAYRPGDRFPLSLLRPDGTLASGAGAAEVLAAGRDPETGAAHLRLRVSGLPPEAQAVVAQAAAGDHLYSLVGPIEEDEGDEVELTVASFPVEVSAIYVQTWYALVVEEPAG